MYGVVCCHLDGFGFGGQLWSLLAALMCKIRNTEIFRSGMEFKWYTYTNIQIYKCAQYRLLCFVRIHHVIEEDDMSKSSGSNFPQRSPVL
jgi:hypothetical protein